MSCLGVHFALTADDAAALEAIDDEEDRLEYLTEEIEVRYFEAGGTYKAESDKSWDAMHRLLADGRLSWDGGTYPLNHAVLAGKSLYGEDDYIMSLKTPAQVKDIAQALAELDESALRKRYDAIDAKDYDGTLDDEDFDYTWHWFQDVRKLYQLAAREGRYMLFTADQ